MNNFLDLHYKSVSFDQILSGPIPTFQKQTEICVDFSYFCQIFDVDGIWLDLINEYILFFSKKHDLLNPLGT